MPKRLKHPIVRLRFEKTSTGNYRAYMETSYPGGKRTREALGIMTDKNPFTDTRLSKEDKARFEQAKAITFKFEQEFRAKHFGLSTPEKPDIEIFTYVKEHIRSKEVGQAMTYLQAFTGNHLMVKQITPEFIQRFIAFLDNKTTLKANSKALYYSKFKAVFNRIRRLHQITENPFDFVFPPKKEKTNKDFLTVEELKIFQQAGEKRPGAVNAFLAMCLSGLRISDITTLTFGELRAGKKRTKKTNVWAVIPNQIHFFASLLKENTEKPDSEKVFPINIHTLKHQINEIGKKTGIHKKITAHTARYTAYYLLHSTGTDMQTISRILTHESINTTQIYARLTDEEIQAAQKRLDELNLKPMY